MTYYETLEISKSATDEEIKRSYRVLAMKYAKNKLDSAKRGDLLVRVMLKTPENFGPDITKLFEQLRDRGF
jgi:DnaJ-class molecular chaperone